MSDQCHKIDASSESGNFSALAPLIQRVVGPMIDPMQADVQEMKHQVLAQNVALMGTTTPGAAPGLIARMNTVEGKVSTGRKWLDRVAFLVVSAIVPGAVYAGVFASTDQKNIAPIPTETSTREQQPPNVDDQMFGDLLSSSFSDMAQGAE